MVSLQSPTRGATGARIPALLACLVLLLVACGGASDPDPESDAVEQDDASDDDDATDEQPEPEVHLSVVAKLAPIADLVEMVGGPRVEVDALVPPGADSHTYEPRPSDLARLADADVFIGVGLDLNVGSLSLARDHLPEDRVVLLGERYLHDDDLVFDHVHDNGHSHGDDGHSHGDDGHSHEDDDHRHDGDGEAGPNPHVWTSLDNAAILVEGIGETLADLDAGHAEEYREAAREARTRIEELADEVTSAAATIPEENRTLVVYHDAWTYFARDNGLEMVTAVQPSDYAEPSAGAVRDVIDLVREHDVPALFGSEVFPSEVMETIGEEAGAEYVGELADDVLPGEPGDPEHSYLGLMRRNAVLIVDHLGGDADGLRD